MHIAIDVSPITGKHELRGIGTYTKSLVEALKTYEKKHSFTLFTGSEPVPESVDLVHYPYFDPFFLTLPAKTRPTVVTVHDLIPLVFPDHFPPGVRGLIKWQKQRKALRSVDHILTDSYASKSDIVKITDVPADNISVVYLAPSEELASSVPHAGLADISGNYVLYVGDVNWNKNIPGLVHAFARVVSAKRHQALKLVLVGRAFLDESLPERQEIMKAIERVNLGSSVIFPGKVDIQTLADLYASASVYVQPSFYEGFGLPVLEAMMCGCPVVATDTSSLKEIAGPAVFCGTESESIARGIEVALTLDRAVQVRIQNEWVREFSWKKTAHETVIAYERVLAKV